MKLMAEMSLVPSQMMVGMPQSLLNRLRLVSLSCAAVIQGELKRLSDCIEDSADVMILWPCSDLVLTSILSGQLWVQVSIPERCLPSYLRSDYSDHIRHVWPRSVFKQCVFVTLKDCLFNTLLTYLLTYSTLPGELFISFSFKYHVLVIQPHHVG